MERLENGSIPLNMVVNSASWKDQTTKEDICSLRWWMVIEKSGMVPCSVMSFLVPTISAPPWVHLKGQLFTILEKFAMKPWWTDKKACKRRVWTHCSERSGCIWNSWTFNIANYRHSATKDDATTIWFTVCGAWSWKKTAAKCWIRAWERCLLILSSSVRPPIEIINPKILRELKTLKRNNGNSLSCLIVSGISGSGKSQLAQQVAESVYYDTTKIFDAPAFVMLRNAESSESFLELYT